MEGKGEQVDNVLKLFRSEVKIVNVGLEYFYKELKKQGVTAVHVAWQPKPKLEKDLEDILSKIL
ncbi:MAG: fdrA domain protein [Thermoprotei archaeon]|nr:MAG: fdrA domain protein [Thermoprotei archaeon]